METKTYSEKLRDPRWQKRRLEVMTREGFACFYCKDTKTTLHVHHKKYTGEPWEAPIDDLQCVCEHCHHFLGWLKKNRSWMPGYINTIRKADHFEVGIYKFFVLLMDTSVRLFLWEPGEDIRDVNNVNIEDVSIVSELLTNE